MANTSNYSATAPPSFRRLLDTALPTLTNPAHVEDATAPLRRLRFLAQQYRASQQGLWSGRLFSEEQGFAKWTSLALEYTGYDLFVEREDYLMDLASGGASERGGGVVTQWLRNGAGLRVHGRLQDLFVYRLRGAYALLKTEEFGGDTSSLLAGMIFM